MKASTWNTYRVSGYTHDVANDQRSAGGVHLHQVRRTKSGWQARVKQSNGRFVSFGAVNSIGDCEGEAYFAKAKKL